jgi:hypothetical protein
LPVAELAAALDEAGGRLGALELHEAVVGGDAGLVQKRGGGGVVADELAVRGTAKRPTTSRRDDARYVTTPAT